VGYESVLERDHAMFLDFDPAVEAFSLQRKDLWEVHRDPYDISRIWVRNHDDGGWLTLFWKHPRSVPGPFGKLALDHALAGLCERGENPTEPEIDAAVAALLDKAAHGPDQPPRAKP
jgi:hypothetical protein